MWWKSLSCAVGAKITATDLRHTFCSTLFYGVPSPEDERVTLSVPTILVGMYMGHDGLGSMPNYIGAQRGIPHFDIEVFINPPKVAGAAWRG